MASSSSNHVIISADTHAGASILDYRPYLPSTWHEEFDAWAAGYQSPWDGGSTTPYSVESLRVVLASMPEPDGRALLGETAAAVYGFDLDRLTALAARVGPTDEQMSTPLAETEYPSDCEWFLATSQRTAR